MMKKINLFISLFMVFVIYGSLSIWGKIGIIRDEYGITGNGISFTFVEMILLIIIPLMIMILNFIMFFSKKEIKNGIKYSLITVSILAAIVLLLSLLVINNCLKKSIMQINQMQELTLDAFMEFCETEKTGLIYVKRDDCPNCIELDKYIDGIIDNTDTIIYYYSTSTDRDKNPDKMYEFLEKINVVSVPAFLKVVNGDVVESFSLEDKEQIAALIKNNM